MRPFVLINKKTRGKLLCSWDTNPHQLFGQRPEYIGRTNGLGGYKEVLASGFYDRRDFRRVPVPIHNEKVERLKFLLNLRKRVEKEINKLLNKNYVFK